MSHTKRNQIVLRALLLIPRAAQICHLVPLIASGTSQAQIETKKRGVLQRLFHRLFHRVLRCFEMFWVWSGHVCHVTWSQEWAEWGACSATCGTGVLCSVSRKLRIWSMNKLRNLEKWTCPGIPENAREKEIREARNQVKMTLVVSLVMSCYVMLCHVISCYFMLCL